MNLRNFLLTLVLLLTPSAAVLAVNVAYPIDGGTGINTATAGDIGNCLKVSNNAPFTYTLGSCGTSTGGFNFTPTSYGNATTSTIGFLNGLISNGSTTIAGLTSGLVGNNNGLIYSFASSSLFGYTPLNPSRLINTTFPLQGGGALSGDLTLTSAFSTTSDSGMSAGNLYVGSGGIFQTAASSSIFGYTPLNPTRNITVAGTANQITSSAGAQDLSADRTWTLSIPQAFQFPLSYTSTYGTTTYASTTAITTNRGYANALLGATDALDVGDHSYTNYMEFTSTGATFIGSNLTFDSGSTLTLGATGVNALKINPSDGHTLLLGNTVYGILDTASISTSNKTFTFPNVTGTIGVGVATTSGSLAYWRADSGLGAIATTTVTCAGTVTCTTFDILGSSPITITGSAGGTYPFTPLSTYGAVASATTSPVWLQSGLYASSTVAFGTAGKDLYFNPTTGRLGIGSTSPWQALSVTGTAVVNGSLIVDGSTASVSNSFLFGNGSAGDFTFSENGVTSADFGYNGTTNRFFINVGSGVPEIISIPFANGYVGIASTSPGTPLGVNGAGVFAGPVTARFFFATSTLTASTFPFASTTAISGVNFNFSGIATMARAVISGIAAAFTPAVEGEIGIDTTSNQFKYYSNSAVRVLGDGNFYPAFTYATATAWTGTTTIPLGPAYTGETWNGVKCFTDAGTVQVSFNDGTNRMNWMNASTTVGTVGLTSNNTFTAGEKRYVDIGTPASSPTKISCTLSKSITAD